MSRVSSIISLSLMAVLILVVSSEADSKSTVVITSRSLTADNKAHTALFEGSVVAKTDDMTIYADRMLVYYDEKKGEIRKIDASGNVKVVKGDRIITSKEATYWQDGRVIFTGEPMATQGDNIITGSEILYIIKEDMAVVKDSKAILKKKD